MHPLSRIVRYIWASPVTLFGLFLGCLTLATRGRAQIVQGAIEFSGGFSTWFLRRRWICNNAGAMTLGHVIIGQTQDDLESARDHEHVHIKQYECWGLFMVPAYVGCSFWLWLRGKKPYWDNPFEKEAYRKAS